VLRVAAVGDVHCTRQTKAAVQAIFTTAADHADVLLLCGDLTDYGLPDEARVLVRELSPVRIPVLAVLGNHDVESDRAEEVETILREAGVVLIDGAAHEVGGVGFAGAKGFGGGFGHCALEPWGERAIKSFVQESIDETLKLEKALARLQTAQRIVVLHYSPIASTVAGEPAEIYPFLGSSRLEEPINRYHATVVFHGHAHNGCPEGRTTAQIPVYNVAAPVLQRAFPERPALRLVEIPIAAPENLPDHRELPAPATRLG